jgi:Ca2+-binding EF-hand superfamily protein
MRNIIQTEEFCKFFQSLPQRPQTKFYTHLLNGFLKKSKKDYDREIRMASNILKRYENEDR